MVGVGRPLPGRVRAETGLVPAAGVVTTRGTGAPALLALGATFPQVGLGVVRPVDATALRTPRPAVVPATVEAVPTLVVVGRQAHAVEAGTDAGVLVGTGPGLVTKETGDTFPTPGVERARPGPGTGRGLGPRPDAAIVVGAHTGLATGGRPRVRVALVGTVLDATRPVVTRARLVLAIGRRGPQMPPTRPATVDPTQTRRDGTPTPLEGARPPPPVGTHADTGVVGVEGLVAETMVAAGLDTRLRRRVLVRGRPTCPEDTPEVGPEDEVAPRPIRRVGATPTAGVPVGVGLGVVALGQVVRVGRLGQVRLTVAPVGVLPVTAPGGQALPRADRPVPRRVVARRGTRSLGDVTTETGAPPEEVAVPTLPPRPASETGLEVDTRALVGHRGGAVVAATDDVAVRRPAQAIREVTLVAARPLAFPGLPVGLVDRPTRPDTPRLQDTPATRRDIRRLGDATAVRTGPGTDAPFLVDAALAPVVVLPFEGVVAPVRQAIDGTAFGPAPVLLVPEEGLGQTGVAPLEATSPARVAVLPRPVGLQVRPVTLGHLPLDMCRDTQGRPAVGRPATAVAGLAGDQAPRLHETGVGPMPRSPRPLATREAPVCDRPTNKAARPRPEMGRRGRATETESRPPHPRRRGIGDAGLVLDTT